MTETRGIESSTIIGSQLRDAFAASATWLERNAEAINALNVFPVPDGDTGLNMALTLRAASDAAAACPGERVDAILDAGAHGALMGARGNSGVILAQYLRGMARALARHDVVDSDLLADSLAAGSDAAYAAVAQPVEGTILTVARSAADAAGGRAAQGYGPVDVLHAAHLAARAAVERTPEQLVVLREAGVVDSGGEGLRVVLEGMLMCLRGDPLPEHDRPIDHRADLSAFRHEEDAFGYCTEVLFRSEGGDVESLRERVAALGTSVLVVADQDLVKVHVHTLRPGAALDLATELGEIVRVKVDNMRLQFQELSGAEQTPSGAPEPGTAIVAVALGDGFHEIFASLDAIVVPGGQSMNPAVGDIVAAIRRAPRQDVLVLPNNHNVILAAEQAASAAAGRSVAVVPTRSMPQGIAAALALTPDLAADANLAAVTRAADRCRTIEITRAARQTEIDGMAIVPGSWIAVLDGKLIGGPNALDGLLGRALDALPSNPYEIATIYVGSQGTSEGTTTIRDVIATRMGVPVEFHRGGQPHYAYIISLE
jgi:DAK2 domain fusion protein YloV